MSQLLGKHVYYAPWGVLGYLLSRISVTVEEMLWVQG